MEGVIRDCTIEGNAYQSDGVSPDTPQEVKGCGDRTGNLWNAVKYRYTSLSDADVWFYDTSLEGSVYRIPCKPNTTYTLYLAENVDIQIWRIREASTDVVPNASSASVPTARTYASTVPASKSATFTTSTSAKYLLFQSNETAYDSVLRVIMLIEGVTKIPYEPYGYKADVECRGKNLINIIPFKATFGTGSAVIRDFLNSLDVGAYVVSYNTELLTRNDTTDNSVYGIRVLNESGNFELTPNWGSASVGTIKKASLKITITEDNKGKFTNVYFYGCGIFSVGVTGSANISDFHLEAGTKATEYSPYTPPITTPIYLDSPLYKIGDYADARGMTEEVRAVKELVLTGEENWQHNNTLSTSNAFYILLSNYMRADGFCSHYSTVADSRANEGIYFGVNINILTNLSDGLSTVADFKAYLAAQYANGTPVKVYYVLSTPEIKAVEPAEIPTINGTTLIDIETVVEPSNVCLKYKSSK